MQFQDLKTRKIQELTFAVVDTETTGMYAKYNRVMDIGIVLVKNGQAIEKYENLINPQQEIPIWITEFTELEKKHVKDKPLFSELADEIQQILDGTIFVAHNAGFDYWFLHHEFKRAGRDFFMPNLCTVKLSKRLIPGLKSAGLDYLRKYFSIHMDDRHRALPDAEATAIILNNLLEIAQQKNDAKTFLDLESIQKTRQSKKIRHNNNVGLFRPLHN